MISGCVVVMLGDTILVSEPKAGLITIAWPMDLVQAYLLLE